MLGRGHTHSRHVGVASEGASYGDCGVGYRCWGGAHTNSTHWVVVVGMVATAISWVEGWGEVLCLKTLNPFGFCQNGTALHCTRAKGQRQH